MSPKRKRRRASMEAAEPQDSSWSPAEGMAQFRQQQKIDRSFRSRYVEGLSFTPDHFQIQAMDALEAGHSVLVAAPTGAGKTVVGEFAVALSLSTGSRAFYTTPIKALSNQKFTDFQKRYGEARVGLLTGDTSINPDAPIIVMTTEVLRNMIYMGADLSNLSHVVLDEVHYLADRFRGPVWEEVLIHLPQHTKVIALSATVSNAEEFGEWIGQVRGSCDVIISETRPVPLFQHMLVDGELYDVYAPSRRGSRQSQRLNPELLYACSPQGRRAHQRRFRSRPATVITLDRANLLPAIVFIFSRAGCEDAVREVIASGVTLTNRSQAEQIRRIAEEATAMIPPEDYAVLGINSWIKALERGIAAHHAGLLPLMKETVEKLFSMGLIRLVYATETLALGINMPARSVVIESLQKWNGVEHVRLSAGEFTQLSGRAGRRGIDVEGHVVVSGRRDIAPEEVAALASKRTYPLVSAFHPTYNMVVNLLAHSTRKATRKVLESSFAQFQADSSVVHLAQSARALERELDSLGEGVDCSRGNAQEYFSMRDRLARLEKEASRERSLQRKQQDQELFRSLKPGQVFDIGSKRKAHRYLVLELQHSAGLRPLLRTLGADARLHTLSGDDLSGALELVAHLRVPPSEALRRHRGREEWAQRIRTLRSERKGGKKALDSLPIDAEISQLRMAIKSHPVHSCPHREEHARAGHNWARKNAEYEKLLKRIDGRTNSVAQQFDRVCEGLDRMGFLKNDLVTDSGQLLRRIFGDRDLIVVEALRRGVWDRLSAPELAAIVSTCVYQSRGEESAAVEPWTAASSALAQAWEETLSLSQAVMSVEKSVGVPQSPELDPGLAQAVMAWANGATLTTAIWGTPLLAGDFVRWIRQVVDLLDQIAHVASAETSAVARQARRLILRGVVSWEGE